MTNATISQDILMHELNKLGFKVNSPVSEDPSASVVDKLDSNQAPGGKASDVDPRIMTALVALLAKHGLRVDGQTNLNGAPTILKDGASNERKSVSEDGKAKGVAGLSHGKIEAACVSCNALTDPVDPAPVISSNITGFYCTHCGVFNNLRAGKEYYYIITTGCAVGVFKDCAIANKLATGVPGNCIRRYGTVANAFAAYDKATAAGAVFIWVPI